jgi:hypothetical protein
MKDTFMSDNLITLQQMTDWLDDLDESLKSQIVSTTLADTDVRENLYNLYQAAQLLRARMLGDFSQEVEFTNNMYDEPQE